MREAIVTNLLTKRYGEKVVVSDLRLSVPTGKIYGFLGPNGSGKSTTMKMLLGLTPVTSGSAEVLGVPLVRRNLPQILPAVGSLIESPPGYGHLTGWENLEIVRRMQRVPRSAALEAARTVRLDNQLDKKVRDYSLGMKQRLGVAFALLHSPKLLVLDEPTNGLDPAGIEEMRQLLLSLAEQGVTVFVSSHLLDEIDKVASHLGILRAGRLVFQGGRDELFRQSLPDVVLRTSDGRAADVLAHLGPALMPEGLRLSAVSDAVVAQAVELLATSQIPVYEVRREVQSLEDVFINLTGPGGEPFWVCSEFYVGARTVVWV